MWKYIPHSKHFKNLEHSNNFKIIWCKGLQLLLWVKWEPWKGLSRGATWCESAKFWLWCWAETVGGTSGLGDSERRVLHNQSVMMEAWTWLSQEVWVREGFWAHLDSGVKDLLVTRIKGHTFHVTCFMGDFPCWNQRLKTPKQTSQRSPGVTSDGGCTPSLP